MAPLKSLSGRFRGKRGARGAELVEFAFVLPLLLFVLLGIIDFGFLFHDYEVVTNAAREGARLKSLADGYSDTNVETRVKNYISFGGLDPNLANAVTTAVSIPVSGTVNVNGNSVVVTYPHQLRFLGAISGFFGASFGTVTLTASSTMRSE